MKSDFVLAITQLSAEKNLPKEVVISAVEAALASAYRKDTFAANQNISVKINPTSGKVEVWAEKTVTEHVLDSRCEISLDEAQRIKSEAQVGQTLLVEATPRNAGRIAAQTAKQVILQRLHEAEHTAIFDEYAGREGDILTGVVQHIEPRQVFIDLGRTEAILPASEQMPNERYRIGQRLKLYILEVARTNKGPRVVLSRSHPDLLRRLFEMEVPEIFNKTVELKVIAREAGFRSKVAVAAKQEGVDPVGCCVGLRGIRIQNIVSELNGEKIDVVMWSPDTRVFIANALSPAQILSVVLDEKEKVATVIVPDRQLSLAIGREGQNVRLAAKLTGWRIDIKNATAAEAEKIEAVKPVVEAEREAAISEEIKTGKEAPAEAEVPAVPEPALMPAGVAESLPAFEKEIVSPVVPFKPPVVSVAAEKSQIRFAEDILAHGPAKAQPKSRRKEKKGTKVKEGPEEGIRVRKSRRGREESVDEEEYDSGS